MRRAQRVLFEEPVPAGSVADFIATHKLHPGDVAAFSDYRDSLSFVVDADGQGWTPNADEMGAGYLSIPLSATALRDDGVQYYRPVWVDAGAMTVTIGPRDAMIVGLFGDDVPIDWIFSVEFHHGEIHEVHLWTQALAATGRDGGWVCLGHPSTLKRETLDPYRVQSLHPVQR
eukprot:Polyplicarium_translucidae@DN558_c0_g1_i1.p1